MFVSMLFCYLLSLIGRSVILKGLLDLLINQLPIGLQFFISFLSVGPLRRHLVLCYLNLVKVGFWIGLLVERNGLALLLFRIFSHRPATEKAGAQQDRHDQSTEQHVYHDTL